MSLPVTFSFASLPAGYCWPGPTQYWTDLQALITGVVDSGVGYNFGATTPDQDHRVLPWVRTDANGALVGLYTYSNGVWVRPHPIPPSSSFRTIWVGTLAALKTVEDGVDEAVTETTGPFWEEDTSFQFRCPLGVGTNSVTYDGAAATSIGLGATLGAEKVTLDSTMIPAHAHTVEAWGQSDSGTGALIGGTRDAVTVDGSEVSSSVGGGLSHQNMQPSIGVYFVKRTSRKFFTVAG